MCFNFIEVPSGCPFLLMRCVFLRAALSLPTDIYLPSFEGMATFLVYPCLHPYIPPSLFLLLENCVKHQNIYYFHGAMNKWQRVSFPSFDPSQFWSPAAVSYYFALSDFSVLWADLLLCVRHFRREHLHPMDYPQVCFVAVFLLFEYAVVWWY